VSRIARTVGASQAWGALWITLIIKVTTVPVECALPPTFVTSCMPLPNLFNAPSSRLRRRPTGYGFGQPSQPLIKRRCDVDDQAIYAARDRWLAVR
jgi:hypothetical protein